jgi:MFS family permease
MDRNRLHFLYLNVGHYLDHLFTLVFGTVAALALSREWGLSYAALLAYATPGFVAFGVFSLPAGWLADRFGRKLMIAIFFIAIGLASIATSFAATPIEIGIGLFVIGVFAAIYHPVGLALLAAEQKGLGMSIAINGVWGNLGVGSAALVTGFFIDHGGWRAAFVWPGLASIAIGLAYLWHFGAEIRAESRDAMSRPRRATGPSAGAGIDPALRRMLIRLSAIIFLTAALSSIIFQSTTFALPKVFDERLGGIAGSATMIGWLAFVVFAVASLAQLAVGMALDRLGPRTVFMGAATVQIAFFALMPGATDWLALAIALGFMLGAFGQIPITDYMIGRLASGELRASIYGVRYVVSFIALAAALPLIAVIHANGGFDLLFRVLAVGAVLILATVSQLPRRLPAPVAQPAAT